MKLLLDENLSRRIVPHITSYYPGSSQIALLGLEQATDKDIWDYAYQHDFVIVTKDYDFIDLSTLYGSPPHVVLLKTGNQTWQATAQTLINCQGLLKSVLVTANIAHIEITN
ncbi:hypothetical protein TI05_07695 [Achromatium sp. WMS3]|nr:hypothetical protein TI05_07695 [Achromatium sp. WMS3]